MDRPLLCDLRHRPILAAAARQLLVSRERNYPDLVAGGQLTAKAAADGIRCARALHAQWCWIIDPASPPLPPFDYATGGSFGAPSSEIAADLARTAARTRKLAERTPDEPQLAELADCYAALAWCQQGDWIVEMISGARIITQQLRAALAPQLKKAA